MLYWDFYELKCIMLIFNWNEKLILEKINYILIVYFVLFTINKEHNNIHI